MATKMNAGFMAMMKKKTSDKPMKKEGMAKTKKMAFGGPASIAAGNSPVRAAVNNAGKAVGAGTSIANAAINALKNAPPPTKAPIKQGLRRRIADGKNMASGGYAEGGMPMVEKDGKKVPSFAADGKGKMAKGGMAKTKKMASGGSASSRADGIAVKGKTKGKMMANGGKC
jgi:hypothetical protein